MSSADNSGTNKEKYIKHVKHAVIHGVLFLQSAKSISEYSRLRLEQLRFLQTDSIIWLVGANF